MPRWIRRLGVAGLALVLGAGAAPALETDQFYTWGRELDDSTAALNARVNADLQAVLGEMRGRRELPTCPEVRRAIAARFRFLIFGPTQVWASQSALVARLPDTPEEERGYRRASVYRRMSPLDPAGWLPMTVSISVAGVRLGADKLTHFFNEGHYYFHWYEGARRSAWSLDPAAVDRAIRRGILTERTLLGKAASGVFSNADLEANYQGMLFFIGLCEGEAPMLEVGADGYRLTRPFDWADYVTPEWDESYQPAIYSRRRWREVAPEMRRHCAALDDPAVRTMRAEYVARDRVTVTEERVADLVRAGKLLDPVAFGIERACGRYRFPEPLDESAASSTPSPRMR
jgi:hypothetical protein